MLASVIERLAGHRPADFSAPIPTKNTTSVFTIQDRIPYWFSVSVDEPGWYHMTPEGERVEIVQEMQPYEIFEYLEKLTRFYVITLFPVTENTWMVSPFNNSDASQRGWRNGEPRYMHLVDVELAPLEIVEARRMNSDMLLFHQLGVIVKENTPDMLFAENIVNDYIAEMQRREIERAKAERRKTVQGRMEETLNDVGAELVEWKPNVHGYEVTWSHKGRTHKMTVDENLRIMSAGVCLANTDHWHSLSTIVHVMEDRHNGISDGGYVDDDEDDQ